MWVVIFSMGYDFFTNKSWVQEPFYNWYFSLVMLTRLFLDQLLCHRNHRCITSFELVSIMDIRSCWVVVAMVTSKSTKCSAWSVRVSSATLYLHPCKEEKTVRAHTTHSTVQPHLCKNNLSICFFFFFPGYICRYASIRLHCSCW